MTKQQKAITLYNDGKVKEAFRIFKTFIRSLDSSEKRTLEIAYELLTGNISFYVSIGINTDQISNEAHEIVKKYWV